MDLPLTWFYEVGQGVFRELPEKQSKELEDKYQHYNNASGPQTVILQIGRWEYKFDFAGMSQTNVVTGKTRTLDRRQSQLASRAEKIHQDLSQKIEHLEAKLLDLEQQLEKEKKKRQKSELEAQEEKRQYVHQLSTLGHQLRESQAAREATCKTQQWQFLSHLNTWQPYDAELNARLNEFHHEWTRQSQPNSTYNLTDRYLINFCNMSQENVRSGGQRDIRVVQVSGVAPTHELDVEALLAALDAQDVQAKLGNSKVEEKLQLLFQAQKAKQDYNIERSAHARLQQQVEEKSNALHRIQEKCDIEAREHAKLKGVRDQLNVELESNRQRMEEQRKTLEATCSELREARRNSEDQARALTTLQHQHRNDVDERQRLQQELREQSSALQKAKEKYDIQARELATLKGDQDQLNGELEATKQKVKEQSKVLEQANNTHYYECPRLQQRLRETANDLQQAQTNIATLSEEVNKQAMSKEEAQEAFRNQMKIIEDMEKRQSEALDALRVEKEQASKAMMDMKNKEEKHSQKREKEFEDKRKSQEQKLCKALKSALIRQISPSIQKWFLRELDLKDDDPTLSHSGNVEKLLAKYGKTLVDNSSTARKQLQNLSTGTMSLLGDLPEPKDYVKDYVHEEKSLKAESINDYRFLENLFLSSLKSHRREYRSDEMCAPALIDVLDILTVPFPEAQLKQYRANCERISKHELSEVPMPMDTALRAATSASTDVNEYFLFHGCPWGAVDSIVKNGFHWKHSGKNAGCMYGQGCYFSPVTSKCDQYSEVDEHGHKVMFLARVALGNSLPRWRKCTDVTTLGEKYHSICAVTREFGGSVDHPEAVIFQKTQALPCFKFIYEHRTSCKCFVCTRSGP